MGQHTSKQTVEYFLEPLRDDRIEIIFDHVQPEVGKHVDKEICRAVLDNYRSFLGTFERPNDESYKRTIAVNGDNTTLTESSEILFAKGILQWNVEWKNDKLVVMNATVPNIQTPPTYNIESFVQRGMKFIRHFYASEVTEFAGMMSPPLTKVLPLPEILRISKPDGEIDRTELGKFKDVKLLDIPDLSTVPADVADEDGIEFDIHYAIIREKAIGLGTVSFGIDKFESLLTGFNFCNEILCSLVQPEPTEGVTRTKKLLQQMINLEADEYYADCIKSLRKMVHPEILKCYWEDLFTYLGPLEETIDDAMERCEYKVTTHDNRLPKLVTKGTLKFLNNVMVYEFAWMNSAFLSSSITFAKEVVPYSRSPIIVPAQLYWEKTKKWFLDVITFDKMNILALDLSPGFAQEPGTVAQYNVVKAMLNENWNYENLNTVEFELISPVPMPAEASTIPYKQQITYKFIIRDSAHHKFEAQVKWSVGQYRSYICSFYLDRMGTNLDRQSLELREVIKLDNISFSKVTVDISSVRNNFEDSDQYILVLLHSRQDIRPVSAPFRLSDDSLLTDTPLFLDVYWNFIDSFTLDVTKVVSGTPVILGTLTMPVRAIVAAKMAANSLVFEKDFTVEGQFAFALPVKIHFKIVMKD